jgi:fermentation-respiration switch protein FrsA (DUF1100 family)
VIIAEPWRVEATRYHRHAEAHLIVTRLTIVLVIAAILASLLALLWTFQRSLIYFPLADVPTPEALGLTNVESVTFTTTDGVTLHGWFFPGAESASATVLVCNGNGGHLAYRAGLASALRAHGLNVLLFDYRGYGRSGGAPTETGLAADSRAARAYLLQRAETRRTRLVYFGESLGGAVAIELAEAHPPAGLVLRSPFTSMVDMARLHYPLLPADLLLRDRYPSLDRIARVRAPLLVIAGDQDRIIPLENTRRLYDAASTDKKLVVVPGADHNDVALAEGAATVTATVSFIQALGS